MVPWPSVWRATHPFYDNGQLKGEEMLGYIELGARSAVFLTRAKADRA
jgi:hypothetical protein